VTECAGTLKALRQQQAQAHAHRQQFAVTEPKFSLWNGREVKQSVVE